MLGGVSWRWLTKSNEIRPASRSRGVGAEGERGGLGYAYEALELLGMILVGVHVASRLREGLHGGRERERSVRRVLLSLAVAILIV